MKLLILFLLIVPALLLIGLIFKNYENDNEIKDEKKK